MNQWERSSIWFKPHLEFSRSQWAQSRSSIICSIYWAHQYGSHWAKNITQGTFSTVSTYYSLYMLDVNVVLGRSSRLTALVRCCLLDKQKRQCGQLQGKVSSCLCCELLLQEADCFLNPALWQVAAARGLEQVILLKNLPLAFLNPVLSTHTTTRPLSRAQEYAYWIICYPFSAGQGFSSHPSANNVSAAMSWCLSHPVA